MFILAQFFLSIHKTTKNTLKGKKATNKCDFLHYCYRPFTKQPTAKKKSRHTKCQKTRRKNQREVRNVHTLCRKNATPWNVSLSTCSTLQQEREGEKKQRPCQQRDGEHGMRTRMRARSLETMAKN